MSCSERYNALFSIFQEKTGVSYCDVQPLNGTQKSNRRELMLFSQIQATIATLSPLLSSVSQSDTVLNWNLKDRMGLRYTQLNRMFTDSYIQMEYDSHTQTFVVGKAGKWTYSDYDDALKKMLEEYWQRFWAWSDPSFTTEELTCAYNEGVRHTVSDVQIESVGDAVRLSLADTLYFSYDLRQYVVRLHDTTRVVHTLGEALPLLYYQHSLDLLEEII